mgnify:FL=1
MYVEFEDGQKIRYTIDDVKDTNKAKVEPEGEHNQ